MHKTPRIGPTTADNIGLFKICEKRERNKSILFIPFLSFAFYCYTVDPFLNCQFENEYIFSLSLWLFSIHNKILSLIDFAIGSP